MNRLTRSAVLLCLAMMVMAFTASPAVAGPPTASISGTTNVYLYGYNDQPALWHVSIAGGAPPYSIQWKFNGGNANVGGVNTTSWGGTYLANNADYTWTDTVSVVVKDSLNQVVTPTHTVYGESYYSECAQPNPWNPWEPMYPQFPIEEPIEEPCDW